MKHLSDIKPGDLVRIYDYTHKRREAMPLTTKGHKVGLIVREYPDDTVWPSDYEQFGDSDPDYDREWYVLPIGEEARGSTNQIIVHENRLERMVKE